MKKTIVWLSVFLLVACSLASCGESKTEGDESAAQSFESETSGGSGMMAGAYSIENADPGTLPEDAEKAFNEAIDGLTGVKYTALACIGQQVVSGKNYLILAKREQVSTKEAPALSVLKIYQPLDGKSELSETKDFNLLDYLTGEIDITMPDVTAGGWQVPQEGSMTEMPERLASSGMQAFGDFKELQLEALCSLGTQVVAGTNYALVCRGTSEANASGAYVVQVYEDLEDNGKVISVCPLNLAELLK